MSGGSVVSVSNEDDVLANPSSHDDATPAWLHRQGIVGNEEREMKSASRNGSSPW
jgi:hypothetical protein